ncbi:CoA ester lyase [Candidatus Bathyarchaeota archaeon]|nr:CoA ester lyase [Candidatus Bathyarchaeota archaeon]
MPVIDGELVRRTLLFVPANNPRFVEKAYTRGADSLLLDLEDSVPSTEKETARKLIKKIIPIVGKGGAEVFVRTNSPIDMVIKDVEAITWPGLSGLVYPKASVPAIVTLDKMMTKPEKRRGLSIGSVEIIPLIETAKGILDAYQIATCSSRIRAMAGGVNLDTCLEIGCDGGPDMPWGPTTIPSDWAGIREWMVIVCVAAGIQPMGAGTIDKGPDGALRVLEEFSYIDIEANYRRAVSGRQMGYKGSLCIHPAQVEPMSRGFTPAPEEIDWAKNALKVFEEGVKTGKAAVPFEGRMVDIPVAERARKLVLRAEIISKWDRMKADSIRDINAREIKMTAAIKESEVKDSC